METILNIPEFKLENSTEEDLSTIQHFGFFSKKDIVQNAGRLLMLDIDFGRECSLRCPTCFRRKNVTDDSGNSDLSFDELLGVISDARELGLREIKICGAGEPFENLDLLFPTVGNETERVFYMAQIEVCSGFTPIMNAVISAQDA